MPVVLMGLMGFYTAAYFVKLIQDGKKQPAAWFGLFWLLILFLYGYGALG